MLIYVRAAAVVGLSAVTLSFAACTGNIEAFGESEQHPADDDDGGTGFVKPSSKGNGVLDAKCHSDGRASTPLARLTKFEYERTIRDLFVGVSLPQSAMPSEHKEGSYDAFAPAQTASADIVEALKSNAKAIATAALANPQGWIGCAPLTGGKTCATTLVSEFGKRAFRRPLEDGERDRYLAFYDASVGKFGASTAARMLVEVLLLSPQFLFRVEAPGSEEPTTALNAWELASRLSYFLWDSMPDDELFSKAESKELLNQDVLNQQIKRMLSDARAKQAVEHFTEQWLGLGKIATIKKDATLFPSFGPQMATSLQASARSFVDHAFWEAETLQALLMEPRTFVNRDIADLVGAGQGTASMTLVDVDQTQRAGILTHPGLMAALAHEDVSAPVLRGVFVLDRLLCSAPPPPPAGAVTSGEGTTRKIETTRDKFEFSHIGPSCAGCHEAIDGVGFAFEHYDALGRFRTQENGAEINAKGAVPELIAEPFDGAVQLSERLADSPAVRDCIAGQWAAYAAATSFTQLDECSLFPIVKRFDGSGKNFKELLAAIATSPLFRIRQAQAE
ncbi:MAG: DUF1592 domain-containing protein [Deltaproteobacteria bacterium]|nr:DUF1592 domain-containing protein [Deltaproteobacteria bacterium]